MKKCSKCQIDKENQEFGKDSRRKDRLTCWCKSYGLAYRMSRREQERERTRQWNLKNPEKKKSSQHNYYLKNSNKWKEVQREYNKTPKGSFARYSRRIKDGISFSLTFEEFMTFWQKPCTYCGAEIKTVGIDRVDNTEGYSLENCVSCCWICNDMKSSRTKEFWLEHMKKVLDHFLSYGDI